MVCAYVPLFIALLALSVCLSIFLLSIYLSSLYHLSVSVTTWFDICICKSSIPWDLVVRNFLWGWWQEVLFSPHFLKGKHRTRLSQGHACRKGFQHSDLCYSHFRWQRFGKAAWFDLHQVFRLQPSLLICLSHVLWKRDTELKRLIINVWDFP